MIERIKTSSSNVTVATNRSTLMNQAKQAIIANKNYLTISSPTNAQIAAQVKALTRQNNAIIKLIIDDLKEVD